MAGTSSSSRAGTMQPPGSKDKACFLCGKKDKYMTTFNPRYCGPGCECQGCVNLPVHDQPEEESEESEDDEEESISDVSDSDSDSQLEIEVVTDMDDCHLTPTDVL